MTTFEIRVQGELTADWADWFDAKVEMTPSGDTILRAMLDQAALYGLLLRLCALNLPLIAVRRTYAPSADA